MSIDIDWESLTGGATGDSLAESIRSFIHDKFQSVTLPRMIRSVQVHGFEFGDVPPIITLKDISDPLAEFYEDDGEESDGEGEDEDQTDETDSKTETIASSSNHARLHSENHPPTTAVNVNTLQPAQRPRPLSLQTTSLLPHLLSASNSTLHTPRLSGLTSSNLSYFNLPFSATAPALPPINTSHQPSIDHLFSGTATPLATSSYPFHTWPDAFFSGHIPSPSRSTIRAFSPPPLSRVNSIPRIQRRDSDLDSPPVSHHSTSSIDNSPFANRSTKFGKKKSPSISSSNDPQSRKRARFGGNERDDENGEDIQLALHISYSGNIRLALTAEILLDYPTPSFVGIPLKLTVTGVGFDGVAVLGLTSSQKQDASQNNKQDVNKDDNTNDKESKKRKMHFCFLAADDAKDILGDNVLVPDADPSDNDQVNQKPSTFKHKEENKTASFGLIEEIRVESEIGTQNSGKQSLKNVGKVEKFILDQVRKIFEDEFVYPSFWTFLI